MAFMNLVSMAFAVATILLGVVAIALALFGFFGYRNLKRNLNKVAKRTAEETAKNVTPEVAKEAAEHTAREAAEEIARNVAEDIARDVAIAVAERFIYRSIQEAENPESETGEK